MTFQEILRFLQILGFKRIYQTLISTISRDWWDWKYHTEWKIQNKEGSEANCPSDIVSTIRLPSGGRFRFVCGSSRVDLEIVFLATNLIRFSWGNSKPPLDYAQSGKKWSSVELNHQVTAENYTVESQDIAISVFPDGGIRLSESGKPPILEMLPPEFTGQRSSQKSLLESSAKVYGLGERAAPLNLRPGIYRLWNTEVGGKYEPGKDPLYSGIPVCISVQHNGCFLIFFENPYRGSISVTESLEARFDGGMLRYYVIFGTLSELLRSYADLTGHPSLPPYWALGYHHSKWGIKTEREVEEIADQFQKYRLPISAIHLDIDYMQGFRVFSINRDRFPSLGRLTQKLDKLGIKTVTIIDPGVKVDQNYGLYKEGSEKDYFCKTPSKKIFSGSVWPGRTAFPDFTNPTTREWWGKQYRRLLDEGVAGFWHDMNEPSSFVGWGEMRPPLVIEHFMEGRKGDHLEARNLYGHLMNQAGYEGVRNIDPQKRPWFFSRSGWAGTQRYAWNWTGDIDASWSMLKQTIATVLNWGLSGQPFVGSDTGGFSSNPSPELFVRWFQMSCFLPFFRTHSSVVTKPREPWVFGESVLSILRETLELRYRLMPYLYSLAWESTQNGSPIVRPLFWCYPSDDTLLEIQDAFLLGDGLLVAPVLEEGAVTRFVTLPEGTWYDFWREKTFQGPGQISMDTPFAHIPVLVKGGCILPILENDILVLHVYAPRDEDLPPVGSTLTLYSDAGDGYPKSSQDWQVDTFSLSYLKGRLTLLRRQEGEYPWPYSDLTLKLHGITAETILVDKKPINKHAEFIDTGMFNEVIFIPPE